jgi:hypothetical protein
MPIVIRDKSGKMVNKAPGKYSEKAEPKKMPSKESKEAQYRAGGGNVAGYYAKGGKVAGCGPARNKP